MADHFGGVVDLGAHVLMFGAPGVDVLQGDNYSYYRSRLKKDRFFAPGADVRALIEFFYDKVSRSPKGCDTIFLDISSMPRIWYLSLITAFRFSPFAETHKLVLGYAGGCYEDSYPERQIVELRNLPGAGGYYDASQHVVAILGIGFDHGAALAVEDRVEPDEIYAVVANTPTFVQEKTKSEQVNSDILERASKIMFLPHLSFAKPYQGLCELIAPIGDANVICVPLGPKTHVVAMTLAGLMYPRANSLHVVSRYDRPFRATSNGEFCFGELSVIFEEEDPV